MLDSPNAVRRHAFTPAPNLDDTSAVFPRTATSFQQTRAWARDLANALNTARHETSRSTSNCHQVYLSACLGISLTHLPLALTSHDVKQRYQARCWPTSLHGCQPSKEATKAR